MQKQVSGRFFFSPFALLEHYSQSNNDRTQSCGSLGDENSSPAKCIECIITSGEPRVWHLGFNFVGDLTDLIHLFTHTATIMSQ